MGTVTCRLIDLSVSLSWSLGAEPPSGTRATGREIRRVSAFAVRLADDQVDGRQMAAKRDAHVVAGDVRAEPARGQREVLLHRRLDPFLRVRGLRDGKRHGAARGGEHLVLHVGDLAQQLLRGGILALRGDQVRGGGVARGARFLHIRDGDEADFEALVGLLELARDGIECGLLGLHVVVRGEHVEVARGNTQARSCCATP